jgi:electron transport complex protein RnfE
MLPPGAFIGLGMLLAIKYLIDERTKQRRAQAVAAENVEINTAEKA